MRLAWNPARLARASRAARLSLTDLATLIAVGVVVVLVSLPSLRRFALAQNESDALRFVGLVGPELARASERDLAALLAARHDLARRLDDCERAADGRVLRHGYVLELAHQAGEAYLRAWPWRHGETGLGAFLWSRRTGLVGHANADGRYSGPQHPPTWPPRADEGWRALSRE